jgi:Ca2+-binding EF-hand superfamily protein
VAAVLQYNAMTPRAGFDQFDADEDGKLSVKDLVTTALELGIEASEEALGRLHAMMDDAQVSVAFIRGSRQSTFT